MYRKHIGYPESHKSMSTTQSLSKLRAGIVGTGFIGPVHIEALKRLGIQVTAVCDNEIAESIARRWGIKEVHTNRNYQALIESPEVDVVHIAAPNRLHFEIAAAVLRAGKHCVCEKPLAMNSRETAELVNLASASHGIFAVNYNVRFYPAMLQLRHGIASGEFGRIYHVNGSYFQDWLFKPEDYNWRLLRGEGGHLRAVGDIGTHWMDLVCFVLDAEPSAVMADLGIAHAQRRRPVGEVQTFARSDSAPQTYESYSVDTEDFASILMEFGSGTRGNLVVSQVAAGRKNCIRLEIYGERAAAWWNSEFPNVLQVGRREEANQTWIRNPAQMPSDIHAYSDYPAGHNEGFPDTFKMLYRNIYRCIAAGSYEGALFATAADGHREVKLCEAIEQSAASRAWIKI